MPNLTAFKFLFKSKLKAQLFINLQMIGNFKVVNDPA